METGFLDMIKRSQEGDQQTVVASSPPFTNPEDYPEICTKECPHVQCSSWGVDEMQGKPCRNRVKSNEQILKETQTKITKAVEKAFKPINDRLEKIERELNTPPPPKLNGETIPISRGTNQERINYD